MPQSRYSVEVRDQYGRLVTVLLRAQNKQFTLYRNKPGSCQFTLDLFDPQATAANLQTNIYDVVFRRSGVPVFAGQISYIHPSIDGDTKTVEVIATGYFDLLDQRYVTPDYPGFDTLHDNLPFASTDAAQVAWTLVDDTQFPIGSDATVLMQGTSPVYSQSFVAPGSSTVSAIKLLLTQTSATGNLVLGLYPDAGGAPSSTLVPNSQLTIPCSSITSSIGWNTFTYSSTPPSLVQGQTYWLSASLDTAQSGGDGVAWSYLTSDQYPNGKASCSTNPSFFASTSDLQFFLGLADNSYQMTRNSYLGWQQGSLATSYDVTPTYDHYKTIKSAIEDLSNAYTGIDFNVSVSIDPVTNLLTKSFNVFYPRQGVDNTGLNFTYPGNIKKIDRQKDGKAMVNEVIVVGQGSGVDQLVQQASNTASIQAYGLRQDRVDQADVSDAGTLLSQGQEIVRVLDSPQDLPDIVLDGTSAPSFGSYGIGDTILIKTNLGQILNTAEAYRIEQINCAVDKDDMENIELILSLA
jgi:hypothetical protein